MKRKKVDILCVQETKRKGSKAKSQKLFWKRNGVDAIVKAEYIKSALKVN